MIKRVFFISLLFWTLININVLAQTTLISGQESSNVIYTAVPFLNIDPDSRGGAMGDLGAATKPDINSMCWNPAKYAFMDDPIGIAASYTPWLHSIAPDINLLYLAGYGKLDKQQTIAFAIRYFSLGSITFTDNSGTPIGQKTPNEFTLDGAYSRLFSDKISGGIAFRYIRSDLSTGFLVPSTSVPTKAGVSFAADVAMYYHTPIQFEGRAAEWALGVNISNMGAKISYTDDSPKDFIPTNLKIGTALTSTLDPYNKLTVSIDLNKLLVPTPPLRDSLGVIIKGLDDNVSVPQGMLQALYDAPGGLSEKLKEIMISVGAEYWYRDQFAIRGGYFNESAMKGNRKYFTLGIGLKMTLLTLDFAYLVPTEGRTSPLANTLRLSACIIIGKPRKQSTQ